MWSIIIDQDYKIIDTDSDIVDLMQQFTPMEMDPSIVGAMVEKVLEGYQKEGHMRNHVWENVYLIVLKEAMEEKFRTRLNKTPRMMQRMN